MIGPGSDKKKFISKFGVKVLKGYFMIVLLVTALLLALYIAP